jgi:hypothetical protein
MMSSGVLPSDMGDRLSRRFGNALPLLSRVLTSPWFFVLDDYLHNVFLIDDHHLQSGGADKTFDYGSHSVFEMPGQLTHIRWRYPEDINVLIIIINWGEEILRSLYIRFELWFQIIGTLSMRNIVYFLFSGRDAPLPGSIQVEPTPLRGWDVRTPCGVDWEVPLEQGCAQASNCTHPNTSRAYPCRQ